MKKRIKLTENDIHTMVANTLRLLREGVNDDLFQNMKNQLYAMHKELNKMQGTLMMTGQGNGEYFTQVANLDKSIQSIMNSTLLNKYNVM